VIMYTAMNTMVEKKSMASLANTSFIVLSPGFGRVLASLKFRDGLQQPDSAPPEAAIFARR
jgi:hypothetical protein